MQRPRSLQAGVGIRGSQYKLDAGITTVNGDVLAIDIGAGGRCEEEGAGVEFALLAIAAKRNALLRNCLEVIGIQSSGGEIGVEVAGADAVDGDAVLAPFGCECAGEVHHAALCCMIGRASADEVAHEAIHRSDVDDAAITCLDHLFTEFTCADESAEKVDLHLVLELIIGDFLGGSDGTGACIVHEDIYAAEFLHRCGNCCLHPLGVGDVACERKNLDAEFGGDGLCILFKKVHTTCKKHKICALAGECLGHLEAQASGCAGNDCYAAGEIEIIFHFKYRVLICKFQSTNIIIYIRFTLRILRKLLIWEMILSNSILEGTSKRTEMS